MTTPIAQNTVDVNVSGGELYMCATDYEHELGAATGGAGVYASVADLKACRPCVAECGIVAVRIEFMRYVEHGIPCSERGKETPNARDCEHGHQRGKCPECDAAEDIADLTMALEAAESEARVLRCEVARLRAGHDRYETARRMNPQQWADAWKLSISTGKPFDEIIDNLRPFMGPNADVTGAARHERE